MITITSTANSSYQQLQTFSSETKTSHLRDASFSSYLSTNEETIMQKLSESGRILSPVIINKEDHLQMGEKKEDDGEIGVFEAKKYFNGGMERESPRVANMITRRCLHQKDDLAGETRRIQSGTPSVHSESSWNSQSALLKNSQRSSSKRSKNKVQGKSFLAGLRCKCYCSDENSVDISDQATDNSFNKNSTQGVIQGKTIPKKSFNSAIDPKSSVQVNKLHAESWISKDSYFQKPDNLGVGLNRSENGFPFTTVKSGVENQLLKMKLQREDEEKPKKSLEVFGSPIIDKRSKPLSFDKRIKVPSWDANPKEEEIDFSAKCGGNYNDTDSDASSDLFEIESITGKSNPFLARQSSDAASGCVSPRNGYAPSEASIEWSVVTASAAEYSVMSDGEEQRSVATTRSPTRTYLTSSNLGKSKPNKEVRGRRSSTLLGCKSHKAVRVAGDAFFTYEKQRSNPPVPRRSESFHGTRLQAETKPGSFGSRHGQHAYATQPMQRSHSPHAPQLVYI